MRRGGEGRWLRVAGVAAAVAGLWRVLPRKKWTVSVLALVAVGGMVWALGSLFSQASHYAPGTYYLDKDSVGGTCSDSTVTYPMVDRLDDPTKPFCTMDAADTLIPSGSRVFVRQSTWNTRWTVTDANKTSYVRVQPYPGERVTLQDIWINNSDFWEINGFEVTGWTGTGPSYAQGRIAVEASNDVKIIGNNVHDTVAGVHIRGVGAARIVIAANRFVDLKCVIYMDPAICGSGPANQAGYGVVATNGVIDLQIVNNYMEGADGDMFQLAGRRIRIDHNTIKRAEVLPGNTDHADAIQIAGGCIDCQMTRNIITDSSKGICWCGDVTTAKTWRRILVAENLTYKTANACFDYAGTADLTIRNNTCWDNRYTGLAPDGDDLSVTGFQNNRVYNNIFGPCNESGIYVGDCNGDDAASFPSATGMSSFHHNIIARNSQNRTYSATDIVAPGQAALDGMFINKAADDYRLAAGSIAADAGSSTAFNDVVSMTDLAFRPRVIGASVDIGAYERQTTDP